MRSIVRQPSPGKRITLVAMLLTSLVLGLGFAPQSASAAFPVSGQVVFAGEDRFGMRCDGTVMSPQENVTFQGLPFTNVVQVAANQDNEFFLLADGTVWGCGRNQFGQLGVGYDSPEEPNPLQMIGISGAIAVTAGGSFVAVLLNDGTVWTAGNNYDGLLGDASRPIYGANSLAAPIPSFNNIKAIKAGVTATFALKNDGTLWFWGAGGHGESCNGTRTSSFAPRQVPLAQSAIDMTLGVGHAAIVLQDGTVVTCGENAFYQLGKSSRPNPDPVAKPVPGLTGITKIVAGVYHTLALKNDGTVWAWGFNQCGVLGRGGTPSTPYQVATPAAALGLTGVVDIAASYCNSVALKANGQVYAWGSDQLGQLGDGVQASPWAVSTAQLVTSLSGVGGIATGQYNIFAWGQQASAMTAGDATGPVGGTATLTATVTVAGGGAIPLPGLTVSFTVNGVTVCGVVGYPACPATNSAGVATLTGVDLGALGLTAGTYPIVASTAGNTASGPSSGSATLTVTP